jgi:hypothetical protein
MRAHGSHIWHEQEMKEDSKEQHYRIIGEKLSLIIRQSDFALPEASLLQGVLADLAGAEHELVLPLKIMAKKESFRKCAAHAGSGTGGIHKQALIQDLKEVFSSPILQKVEYILDGFLDLRSDKNQKQNYCDEGDQKLKFSAIPERCKPLPRKSLPRSKWGNKETDQTTDKTAERLFGSAIKVAIISIVAAMGTVAIYKNATNTNNTAVAKMDLERRTMSKGEPKIINDNQDDSKPISVNQNATNSVIPGVPTYPKCVYFNHTYRQEKLFPCRVVQGADGGVAFIDEYAGNVEGKANPVTRHDSTAAWYHPRKRGNECLLRGQGNESICLWERWNDF